MELSQAEWIITGVSGGVLTIVTGTIRYWIAKIKRHSERIAKLENQLNLNDQKDEQYRSELDDKIELRILKLTEKK